jgi:hypothetical protein
MESNQYIHYQLPTPTYATGGSYTQPLQNLPQQLFGRWAHLVELLFRNTLTPTFSAGTIGIIGTNNLVTKCDFFDGSLLRFQGGYNVLRFKERIENGGNMVTDPDVTPATTVVRPFNRVLSMGPSQFAGSPTDFAVPTGMLKSGEIRFSFGAAADVATPSGATVSAVTGTVAVTAKLILLDEIRIPPLYQFQSQAFSAADFLISGRGLYTSIGLYPVANFSSTTAAWAAGDLADITLDMGYGLVVPGINAKDLTLSFNDDFHRGDLLGIQGEPQGAQDVSNKQVDHAGTITALTPVTADTQVVLWGPPDARLTKCYVAENQARLRWSGTKMAGQVLYGRILSQPPNLVAQNAMRALQGTNITPPAPPVVRTLSKKKYDGPYAEFMPWKLKLRS